MKITPFHIAIQVRSISEAKDFYGNKLGFEEGRNNTTWIDYNMFGHQFVCHLNHKLGPNGKVLLHYNSVDSHSVPVPHAGVILKMNKWNIFADRLKNNNIRFIVEPYIRFKGKAGEQATMLFLDPSGNALEFKAFMHIENQLFKK